MATGSTALVNLLMIGVLVAQYLVVIVAGRLHPEARWLLLWSILYWSSYHCSLQSNPPRSMLSWCRPISMSLWTTVAYRASDGLRNRGCGVSRRNIDWIARPELSSAEPTGDPILWRHLMKRLVVWLATGTTILSLAALVAGCGAGGSVGGGARDRDDSKALQSKTWKATEIAGVESVLASKEFEATVKFTEGQMGGSATINRFNATYVTGSGNTIEVGEPVNTLMAGPPEAMAQEQAYLAAIQKAVAYEVTQDSLTLLDDEGKILVKYQVVPDAELIGTQWRAIAYNNGRGGLESLAPESSITATFAEDGTLGGKASINQYTTTYTVSGRDQMTIGAEIAVTRMAGPEDLMAQEAAYLAALPQTSTYEIDGDSLWLRDASGAALAQYMAE